MIKILCRNKFLRINYNIKNYNNNFNFNFNCKPGYFYRNFYCESYEKKLEESKILKELNSSDKQMLNLYYTLKKIELQNENLFQTIKNLENKIDKIIVDKIIIDKIIIESKNKNV